MYVIFLESYDSILQDYDLKLNTLSNLDSLNSTSNSDTMYKYYFWKLKRKYKNFKSYLGLEFCPCLEKGLKIQD